MTRAEVVLVADEHVAWLRAAKADAWLPLREMMIAWLLARAPP
jgi:hypothetical protein